MQLNATFCGVHIKDYVMRKFIQNVIILLSISVIGTLFIYPTQTTYYTLSKHISGDTTPALEPVYVLRNPNWNNNKMNVDVSDMPTKIRAQLKKNTDSLSFPINYVTSNHAVKIICSNKLPKNVHALTSNGGSTIRVDKQYATHSDPKIISKTLTHELGHTLGLLHTAYPTIMYGSNADPKMQPLKLNPSQKKYIKYLTQTSNATKFVARHVTPIWTAKSVNTYVITSQPNNTFKLVGSEKLPSISKISSEIVLINLIPIWLIAIAVMVIIELNKKKGIK